MGRTVSLDDFAAELRKETASAIRAIEGAVHDVAQQLIADSIREVPKDLGALRSSNFVTRPKRTGGTVSLKVGFGGMAASYALFVHEMPEGTNWTTPGTGPKYLERPLNALRPKFGRIVTARALDRYSRGA